MRWTFIPLAAALAAAPLHGQGLSVHSASACALSRNSGGVAEPCGDGSAVFYNPAALALQRGVASAGLVALRLRSTFTFDDTGEEIDSDQGTELAPHVWAAVPLGTRIAAGIGAWAPYGLTTKWPTSFEGRFDGYDNSLRGIYIQPTIAGEVIPGRLSVGIGVAAVRTTVEIRRRLDLAETPVEGTDLTFGDLGVPEGTDFADARLKVDDWSATFHVGVQFLASDRWSLGARYLHSASLGLGGSADFTQVPTELLLPPGNPFGLPAGTPFDALLAPQFESGEPLGDQGLTTDLTLPSQLVVGVRFLATPETKLFFDYQWTGWSDFDRAVLRFADAPEDTLFLEYHDASTFRLAAEYAPREALAVRGGILYNGDAAPPQTVNPLLPEASRISFAAGAGYRFHERFSADAGFEVLFQEERRGRVRPRTSADQTADDLNVGSYTASGIVGALTLSWVFGPAR